MLDSGQTGAGKSHTLFGPKGGAPKDRGVIPRAVKMLFDEINEGTDVDEVCLSVCTVQVRLLISLSSAGDHQAELPRDLQGKHPRPAGSQAQRPAHSRDAGVLMRLS